MVSQVLDNLPQHARDAAQAQQNRAAAAMAAEAERKETAHEAQRLGLSGEDFAYDGDPADLVDFQQAADRRQRQRTSQAPAQAPEQGENEYLGLGDLNTKAPEYEESELGLPNFVTARFRLDDGSIEELELEVPEMTMERIELFSWWQHQVALKHNALLNIGPSNPKGLMQAQLNSRRAKERFICFAVPTFPAERFPQLTAESFMKIVAKLDEKRADALGQADAPQTGAGRPNR